jgi:hypothetical protein
LRVREYGAEKNIWASEEVGGGWRKLHKLHNICSSPHTIRVTKPGKDETGDVARMGEKKNAYGAFASKTARKRPFGKTGHGRENRIKMDIKEIRLGVAASTGFIRRRMGTICEHDCEPSSCIKSGELL